MSSSTFFANIIRFFALVMLQVLVFNNIELHRLFIPFVYVYFLLMLPSSTSQAAMLLLGFAAGYVVDVFSNTVGMHAGACTLLAFLRPYWFNNVKRIDIDEEVDLRDFSFGEYLKYSSVLIFVHHLGLFILESLSFRDFFDILLKTFVSTILTLVFVFIFRYLFLGNKSQTTTF